MINTQEALKMAIDTIKKLWKIIDDIDTYDDVAKENDKLFRKLVYKKQKSRYEITGIMTDGYEISGGAINACKEALEQQEASEFFERGKEIAKWADEQNKQEPVAWMHIHDGEVTEFNDFKSCEQCIPLYTHPAKQLSDDEISNLYNQCHIYDYKMALCFARAIEAKVRGE